MRGQIINYNEERGFGFIKVPDVDDVFFHVSSLRNPSTEPLIGAQVEFTLRRIRGRARAEDIETLAPGKPRTNTRIRRTSYTPDYSGKHIELPDDRLTNCLREIAEWKLEAKLENSEKYFMSVPEVQDIKTGKKSFVIGRKGSGKTAIVTNIYDTTSDEYSSEKLSFKNFPFNELYKHEDNHFTRPNQYITLWKYIIYSTVVRMMANRSNIDPLLRKKIRKVYPETDASDLRGLLKKWTAGDFSLNILGSGFSFANWLSRNTETSWFDRVDHLEKFISQNCDSSTYIVSFDELDEDYKEMFEKYVTGSYIPLLTSLFKAVQDIMAVMKTSGKNIYPVVFLRDDIFDLISDSDKNKWRDLTTNLEWSLPEIKLLLKHRLERAADIASADFYEVWHSVFDDRSVPYAAGRKSLHSLDFISRSTQGRPRDYIHYLQVCAESQLAVGGGRIDSKTVVNADKTYSNYLKNELTDEIHGVIPDISNVFRVLSQIRKWILSPEEFTKVFEGYVAKQQIRTNDAGFVLQTLFYFSVIGNVSRNHNVHIFRHEHPEAVFNFNENIVIHRGLMKALQIL